jgi:preprotein translocase subunit Sec63
MKPLGNRPTGRRRRSGLASLDYVLVLGVILPLVVFVMWAGPRIVRLAYEMVCVLISWPFM